MTLDEFDSLPEVNTGTIEDGEMSSDEFETIFAEQSKPKDIPIDMSTKQPPTGGEKYVSPSTTDSFIGGAIELGEDLYKPFKSSTELGVMGAKRPVLGLMRTMEDAGQKLGIGDEFDDVANWISDHEEDIESKLKEYGLDEKAINPADLGQIATEIGMPLGLIRKLRYLTPAEGASAYVSARGEGKDQLESGIIGLTAGTATLLGGVAIRGLKNLFTKADIESSPDKILDYIKEHDEVYSNSDKIQEALDNYYKVNKPSGNLEEDTVRALLDVSPKLGEELKAGASMVDKDVIPALRKKTQTAIDNLSEVSSPKDTGTGDVLDIKSKIDSVVGSKQYKQGLDIIEKNYNADITIPKNQYNKLRSYINKIAELEPDAPEIKALSNKMNQLFNQAKKTGKEPSLSVLELIDIEKTLGKASNEARDSVKSYKIGEVDTFITKKVSESLKAQPEGDKLYKQMKQIHSEMSPFNPRNKVSQQNEIGKIFNKIGDITPDTAIKSLLQLKDKGIDQIDQLEAVIGKDKLQQFENIIVNSAINSTKDFRKISDMLSTMDFKTPNGKLLKNKINELSTVMQSEGIEDRIRGMVQQQFNDGTSITANLLSKVQYKLMGTVWSKIMSRFSSEAREVAKMENMLTEIGRIIKDPNEIKKITKISDGELKRATNEVVGARKNVVDTAKDTTKYQEAREVKRAENKKARKEARDKRKSDRKSVLDTLQKEISEAGN